MKSTSEGIELSLGDFHSGSTFSADIDTCGNDQELQKALKNGYTPVFYVVADEIIE